MMAATVTRVAGPAWRGRVYRVAHPAHQTLHLPSVTSILGVLDKGALLPWAVRTSLDAVRAEVQARLESRGDLDAGWLDGALRRAAAAPDDAKNAAADVGTRVHAAIDAVIRGAPPGPPLPPDVTPAVAGFRAWYASSGLALSPAGDFAVYSRRYRYAGAADCLGRAPDGGLVVLDFKTSNATHGSYALQLAAYAHAVREMAADGELDVDAMLRGSGAGGHAGVAAAASSSSAAAAAAAAAAPPPGSTAPGGGPGDGKWASGALRAAALPGVGAPLGMSGQGPPPAAGGGSRGGRAAASNGPSPQSTASRGAAAKRRGSSPPPPAAFLNPIVDDDLLRGVLLGGGGGASARFSTAAGDFSRGGGADADAAAGRRRRGDAAAGAADAFAGVSALVVRLDKATGAVEVRRVADLGRAFDAFKAALLLWHAMQGPLLDAPVGAPP